MQNNLKVRDYAKSKGIPLWKIAEKIGCNDGNFSRKLRKELPIEEQQRICAIIDALVQEEQ